MHSRCFSSQQVELLNVGFTCKVVWRGPGASQMRNKLLCQVEALVRKQITRLFFAYANTTGGCEDVHTSDLYNLDLSAIKRRPRFHPID